jgi:hypothetical protein
MTVTPPVKKRTAGPARLRFRAFRRLLIRNEIFFKTVAATALTGASIFIGVQQLRIAERQSITAQKQSGPADKQLALTNLQSQIAEAQALPSFEMRIITARNDAAAQRVLDLLLEEIVVAVGKLNADEIQLLSAIKIANGTKNVETLSQAVFSCTFERSKDTKINRARVLQRVA